MFSDRRLIPLQIPKSTTATLENVILAKTIAFSHPRKVPIFKFLKSFTFSASHLIWQLKYWTSSYLGKWVFSNMWSRLQRPVTPRGCNFASNRFFCYWKIFWRNLLCVRAKKLFEARIMVFLYSSVAQIQIHFFQSCYQISLYRLLVMASVSFNKFALFENRGILGCSIMLCCLQIGLFRCHCLKVNFSIRKK